MIMKKIKIWIFLLVAALSVTLTACDELFSMEYKIVGSWQVSHTYLNGEEIDSTNYAGFNVGTYYYIYADHVMEVRAFRNNEWRTSTFATYIVNQKEKTVEMEYTLMGNNYHFLADIDKLTRKEFFIEFDDKHGDHWRLELFSRSNN